MATCSIMGLSLEIILQIIDLVPPASHLDFACTCKHIAKSSSKVLHRHRNAYQQYRAASDLDPATVPTLLRSALSLSDPIPAWHVRSLEIWRDRKSWKEWKIYSFLTPVHDDRESTITSCKLQDDEVMDYLDTLGHRLNGDEYGRACTQAENGHDGILKMLLLAHCPRIESLKFITQTHDEDSCLHWLKTLISNCISCTSEYLPDTVWPSGLASLRDVAIGVPSDTWMDNRSQDPSSHLFVHLLRLPNITSIYYKDLCAELDDEHEYAKDIPPRCSSVKHLFLDNCDTTASDLREALYRAPCSLLTASFRSGDTRLEHADHLASGFSEEQESLESLMFYDFGRDPYETIHGRGCRAYQPDEIENSRLKQVSISVEDIEILQWYLSTDVYYIKYQEDEEDPEDAFVRHTAECYPWSMESLILWGEAGTKNGFSGGDNLGRIELFGRAIVKMLEDGAYPNLKAIYLEEIEHNKPLEERIKILNRWMYLPIPREPRTELCFQDAVAAGKKRGVDVHTLTNRSQLMHDISFPEAPDKYALETGPDFGKGDKNWVFNPYIGRRVRQGCKKCGFCENCKAEYSEDAWNTVRDD